MTTLTRVPLEQTLELRDRMLSPGHPGRPVVWPYDDEDATHWGAFEEGRLVGCVSHCPGVMPGAEVDAASRFHSMAVDRDWQGRGVGRLLLSKVAGEVLDAGARLLFATARTSALQFYLRLGMQRGESTIVEETGFRVDYVFLDQEAMRELCLRSPSLG